MKQFSPILLACVLAIPVLAQDAKTNASPDLQNVVTAEAKDHVDGTLAVTGQVAQVTVPATHEPGQTFPVSAGAVSAPFVLTNGYIYQAAQNSITDDGKASYNFIITNAGNYVIRALVNAPEEGANSFYVNIDAQPEDPVMIWDVEVTTGFEERTVNWRGNGTDSSDEFIPKQFTLAPGTHKLIIVGREADTQLKTMSILSAAK